MSACGARHARCKSPSAIREVMLVRVCNSCECGSRCGCAALTPPVTPIDAATVTWHLAARALTDTHSGAAPPGVAVEIVGDWGLALWGRSWHVGRPRRRSVCVLSLVPHSLTQSYSVMDMLHVHAPLRGGLYVSVCAECGPGVGVRSLTWSRLFVFRAESLL